MFEDIDKKQLTIDGLVIQKLLEINGEYYKSITELTKIIESIKKTIDELPNDILDQSIREKINEIKNISSTINEIKNNLDSGNVRQLLLKSEKNDDDSLKLHVENSNWIKWRLPGIFIALVIVINAISYYLSVAHTNSAIKSIMDSIKQLIKP